MFSASFGEPLRLPGIDQGVAQINRLRRNQTAARIPRGTARARQ
ncbi:POTRA domain-containing protein [Burkholderia ubonensis]|nr:POTRA domain-containing protein [Burkholderia ubonensis]